MSRAPLERSGPTLRDAAEAAAALWPLGQRALTGRAAVSAALRLDAAPAESWPLHLDAQRRIELVVHGVLLAAWTHRRLRSHDRAGGGRTERARAPARLVAVCEMDAVVHADAEQQGEGNDVREVEWHIEDSHQGDGQHRRGEERYQHCCGDV